MCLLDDKPTIYRHKTTFTGDGDYTSISDSELAIVREGLHTYYELRVPWKSLMPELQEIQPGTELKFSMVINENDGVGRVGYMTYGEGIVGTKDSTKFKRLYIREQKKREERENEKDFFEIDIGFNGFLPDIQFKAEELKQTTTTTGVRILTIYLWELRSQAVLQDGGAEQWDAIL